MASVFSGKPRQKIGGKVALMGVVLQLLKESKENGGETPTTEQVAELLYGDPSKKSQVAAAMRTLGNDMPKYRPILEQIDNPERKRGASPKTESKLDALIAAYNENSVE